MFLKIAIFHGVYIYIYGYASWYMNGIYTTHIVVICMYVCMHIYVYTCTHMYILHTQYTRVCVYIVINIYTIEGSSEVKLPTIWTDENPRDGKSQRREEKKKEGQKRESPRRKKIQVREKVGKSQNTVFFPMICGSGGSKSRLVKAAPRWDISSANQMLQLKI